jgi:hypothetical protein
LATAVERWLGQCVDQALAIPACATRSRLEATTPFKKKSPASLRGTLLISAELSDREIARTRRIDLRPRCGRG